MTHHGNGKETQGEGPRPHRARRRGPEPSPSPETPPPKRRNWGASLLYYLAVLGVWATLILAAVIGYFASSLPSTQGLWTQDKSHAVTIYDRKGRLIARRGVDSGLPVALKDLPPHVAQAVIATEDRRFYQHFGLDPIGLVRALWVNIEAGRVVQGGSTITQQLAKNLFLEPDRTVSRKIQEALLAFYLENSHSKDEIITLYLNRVYFGGGAFGIDAAARRYFDKPAGKLTLIEAAILAGLLKAPSRFSPVNGMELAYQRATLVLNEMREAGFITRAEFDEAVHTRPKLALRDGDAGSQYFADWVLERLPGFVGRPNADLVVETTFDTLIQAEGETALTHVLDAEGDALQIGQGALIALAPDGAIRAMVGGRSYRLNVFNRAAQARRQPGSAFKPFVFLTALEHGLTPSDTVQDAPFTKGKWTPQNFEPSAVIRTLTLAQALSLSVNTAAARLCVRFGPRNVVETAQRLGIVSDLDPVDSLALGTEEVSLIELANAYVPFANGGAGAIAYGITRVRSVAGETLYERTGSGIGPVVNPTHVAQMNAMLSAAMETGTGRRAHLGMRPAAGKTGTTQDFRDAWFIGYTPDLIAGVWVGNDNGQPMNKVTGGTIPTLIWKEFMLRALANTPVRPLPGLAVASAPIALAPTLAPKSSPASSPEAPAEAAYFDAMLTRIAEPEPEEAAAADVRAPAKATPQPKPDQIPIPGID